MAKDINQLIKGRQVRPMHPGEILDDILVDLEVTQTQFAAALGVSRRTVNEIIQGHRAITVDTAIRISKALDSEPQLWLNLQQKVDLWDAIQSHQEEYSKIPTVA
jgi:antitoxin HigA-1